MESEGGISDFTSKEGAPERFPRGIRIWGHLRNAQNRRLGRAV